MNQNPCTFQETEILYSCQYGLCGSTIYIYMLVPSRGRLLFHTARLRTETKTLCLFHFCYYIFFSLALVYGKAQVKMLRVLPFTRVFSLKRVIVLQSRSIRYLRFQPIKQRYLFKKIRQAGPMKLSRTRDISKFLCVVIVLHKLVSVLVNSWRHKNEALRIHNLPWDVKIIT